MMQAQTPIKDKIWLSSPHMGENESRYIAEAFSTNWIAPLGPHVDGFEEDIEEYLSGGVYVAALSSGTGALHLALILLGVKDRDDVICQSMTFSASANPIVYERATPIFVDSERETWNMDADLLEQAIKDRIAKGSKPKAIIVVHLYGMPANMDRITAVAEKFEIPIIEDAAEALGSEYNGQKAGTFGKISILSFNGNKIITTSGGGALVSNEKNLVERARFLSTQARDAAPHYQHSQIGYNYRMSNVCAGIGRGQMEVLSDRVEKRRSNFHFYRQKFANFSDITFQIEPSGQYYSNHWLTALLFKDFQTRECVRNRLLEFNIESRPLWKPMHQQPVFQQYPLYGNGVSEDLFERGLCLPSGSNLSDEQLNLVASKVLELL
jgi:dTDP-4-amino-4,6-dideoxygalactose transaminase